MSNHPQVSELKQQIKATIRRNSDHGFVPYAGCNRVCAEMASIMNIAESCRQATEYHEAFDIYLMLILESARLVSHADDSDGGCSDIILCCIDGIDAICKQLVDSENQYFYDALVKTAKNKVFEPWPDWAYRLLKVAVYFVNDQKWAGKIYDILPTLGKMYNGEDYPDKHLITLGIIERLEGKEAARKYIFEHLELDEIREIAVKNGITEGDFVLAERLCREALMKNDSGRYARPSRFFYYLEQVHEITNNTDGLVATRRAILMKGDTAYFRKLKSLYEELGVWEQEKEPLWSELPRKIGSHNYTVLLAQENELELLLEQVKMNKSYITYFGKQLAAEYPDQAYQIYEEYIYNQAEQANDRRKYRQVCSYLKGLAEAGAKTRALTIITRLNELYPRRPAMLDELAKLERKLNKWD
jgi:hypothetical protein